MSVAIKSNKNTEEKPVKKYSYTKSIKTRKLVSPNQYIIVTTTHLINTEIIIGVLLTNVILQQSE